MNECMISLRGSKIELLISKLDYLMLLLRGSKVKIPYLKGKRERTKERERIKKFV